MTNSNPVSYHLDVTDKLKNSSLFHVLLITTLAIGLYLNSLTNGFVYDDEYTIENNTLIKGFDNLPLLFNNSAYFGRSGEMSYRPVVTFSYLVDYALYDLKPWGYHLTNLLLHAINGVLLYIFLSLLLTPYSLHFVSVALLVSLLFVSHPVLTEAVNCISYREDLLVFLFYITALILYLVLRQPATGHRSLTTVLLYLFSCFAYLISLLSKEMAVTLPLVVLCYEWLYGEGEESLISRLFSRYIIGYVAITVFYLYLRFFLFYNPEEQAPAWGLTERFLTLPWLVLSYLKLSLFPVQLSADYVIKPVTYVLSPSFIWPFISIVSILVVSFILRKKKEVFFGAFFFLTTLLPVYNIIPISNPLAERYIYLPMAGLVILVGMIINAIGSQDRKLLFISLLLILCVFAFSVVKRNTVWRDNYSLWTDTSRKMPNSSRANNSLGNVFLEKGTIEKAIEHYRIAIKINPTHYKAHYNLGNAYSRKGRLDEAIHCYRTSITINPNYSEAHNNLGTVYEMKGMIDAALAEYFAAAELNSQNKLAGDNLKRILQVKTNEAQ